jgi:hypothetical protein
MVKYVRERLILEDMLERQMLDRNAVPVEDVLQPAFEAMFDFIKAESTLYYFARNSVNDLLTDVLSSPNLRWAPDDDMFGLPHGGELDSLQRYYRIRRHSNTSDKKIPYIVRLETLTDDEIKDKAEEHARAAAGHDKHRNALLLYYNLRSQGKTARRPLKPDYVTP